MVRKRTNNAANTTHAVDAPNLPAMWKYVAPRLSKRLLVRERLLRMVEDAVGPHLPSGNVLLVSAAAGYGKSTLLAQWAHRTHMPVAWYHIGAEDDDPVVFLTGLLETIRRHARSSSLWRLDGLLAQVRGTLSAADVPHAVEVLAHDLRQHVTQPCALIVTECETLRSNKISGSLLKGILLRPPDALRIVLESREIPEAFVSPLLTRDRLAGIGSQDLEFTARELSLLLKRMDITADDHYVERLRALSGGWITGVLLAIGALWPHAFHHQLSDGLNRAAILEYLASEVIDRLPDSLATFAARASILTYMTAAICARILEIPDAEECLALLERRAGFMTRTDRPPQEPIYQFQPFLRAALLRRLEQEDHVEHPQEMSELRVRAGILLEEQEDYEEAVQQYAQAGAYDRVVDTIVARRSVLLRRGRGATIDRWIDLIPPSMRQRFPQLVVISAQVVKKSGQTDEAAIAAERACALVLPQAMAIPEWAAWALAARADVAYTLGNYQATRRDCEAALTLAPEGADEVHVEIGFVRTIGELMLSGPTVAQTYLDGIEERCRRIHDMWALARLYYLRSHIALTQGRFVEAESAAATGLEFGETAGDDIRTIVCRQNLGGVRQFLGRFDLARRDLEQSRRQASHAGNRWLEAYSTLNLADLELSEKDYTRAIDLYAQALEGGGTGSPDRHLRVAAAAGQGWALALLGREATADDVLVRELREVSMEEQGLDWAQLTIARGFVYYRRGMHQQAQELLSEASSFTQAHAHTAEYAKAQLVLAAVLLAQGQELEVSAYLQNTIELAARTDETPSLLLDIRHLELLWPLMERVDHPIARALIRQVTTECDLAVHATDQSGVKRPQNGGATTTAARRADGHGLYIFALGEPHVIVGTQRVTHWQSERSREFLYFLAERESVSTEEALEALWPDADPRRSRTAFRQVRHRLKATLENNYLACHDGYWHLTSEPWYDVREFEREAGEGLEGAQKGDHDHAITRLNCAITYWTGEYLTGLYSDWALRRRERLRRLYALCLQRLAESEVRLNRYDDAAQHWLQLVAMDPYNEEAQRGLMAFYVRRGEVAKAAEHYLRYAKLLRDELGVEPGPETTAAYIQLWQVQQTTRA